MIIKEVRHDMQVISPAALGSYMKHRGYTVRTLADAVDREVRRKHPKLSATRSTIGHLRNPKSGRRNVRPEVGIAIERVLEAPPGSLFVDRLSSVERETYRKQAS